MVATPSITLNACVDTLPMSQPEPTRASAPRSFRQVQRDERDERVSCALIRSKIEAAVGILLEN